MKALWLFTIVCSFFVAPVFANDSIKGTVRDSLSGKPISGVTVKVTSPSCSTVTDTSGNFSFSIISTAVQPTAPKLVWNQEKGLFFSGSDKARLEVVNLKGANIVSAAKLKSGRCALPPGVYFIVVRDGSRTSIAKIVNAKSDFRIVANSGSASGLAKTAAATYLLNFKTAGYNPASRSVVGSVSDLTINLMPVRVTGLIRAKVTVRPVGSLTNGPDTFGSMVQPNKLIVRIYRPATTTYVVTDTIRSFVIGQVLSKVYSNLDTGSYQVGAWTVDSLSGSGVNAYHVADAAVAPNQTDTVSFDLQAMVVHFAAKFAPNDSAVKFETCIKALDANYQPLPVWTDSLVFAKGKKDTSVILKNLELANAGLPPYVTHYDIRFRVYGDTGASHTRIVLYEGTDSNVAVSPGVDQSYAVDMKAIKIVPMGTIRVNAAVQKVGSLTNGPAVFNDKIDPNWLIIRLRKESAYILYDTIRNFTPGQTFSKVYPNLESGFSYGVSAWTKDSISGSGVNGYDVIDVNVNTNETATANLNLVAMLTHFSAKFAPNDSVVKFETYIKALNASYQPLPTWTDSVVFAKGKKDTTVITRNLPLSNAPDQSNYEIRFRAYGDTGISHQRIVLYEGISDVSVSPGADVPYAVAMNPVTGMALSKAANNAIRK
ncbi:MAG: hypothetical protein PHE24_05620 [Patescibacteria group bacterium]|nr:hypothetical protein [Patescibacteria group bacterium]